MRLIIDRRSVRAACEWNEIPARILRQNRKGNGGWFRLNRDRDGRSGVTSRIGSITRIVGIHLIRSAGQQVRYTSKIRLIVQRKRAHRKITHDVTRRILREPD